MGIMPPPEYCHITGLKTENFISGYDLAEYLITINNRRMLFRFHWNHINNSTVEKNKYILNGLLLNEKFPSEYGRANSPVLTNEILERIIFEAIIPRTPENRLTSLLTYMHSLQEFEGATISWPDNLSKNELSHKLYFKNYEELVFYLFTLKNNGLIDGIQSITKDGSDIYDIVITYKGLSKLIEINESGSESDKCFVAMSFSKSQIKTRETIKDAIRICGFDPILIDEQNIDSDVTINDAMIAEIKKAKFLIADFSEQKHGVYFEAGYALGQSKPVIYLCKRSDFENSHFDINHYSHIVYDSLEDLKDSLEKKIEAWIKK